LRGIFQGVARVRYSTLIMGLALLLAATSTVALEKLDYQTVESGEAFELRRYPSHVVAEIEMSGDFSAVGGQAFGALADFIGGNNRAREKIAMTAPVNQRPANGQRIAMTAPVTQTALGAGAYVVSFVMPAKYTLDTVPQPVDSRIRLREVPARLMAARGYSGTWSEANYRENEQALLAALAAAGLKPVGPPIWARYDPPFMPWFLRRNEVLVAVEAVR
jgi:hypothetical protein